MISKKVKPGLAPVRRRIPLEACEHVPGCGHEPVGRDERTLRACRHHPPGTEVVAP